MPFVQQLRQPSWGTASPSSRSKGQAPLNAKDVCVGCILWLPVKTANYKVRQFEDPKEELHENGYDHPIVVLKVMQREGSKRIGDLLICFALVYYHLKSIFNTV